MVRVLGAGAAPSSARVLISGLSTIACLAVCLKSIKITVHAAEKYNPVSHRRRGKHSANTHQLVDSNYKRFVEILNCATL